MDRRFQGNLTGFSCHLQDGDDDSDIWDDTALVKAYDKAVSEMKVCCWLLFNEIQLTESCPCSAVFTLSTKKNFIEISCGCVFKDHEVPIDDYLIVA